MSADNGIYILKTLSTTLKDKEGWSRYTDPYPVYRVAETCAIENFDFYKREQPYNIGAYLKEVWGTLRFSYPKVKPVLTPEN